MNDMIERCDKVHEASNRHGSQLALDSTSCQEIDRRKGTKFAARKKYMFCSETQTKG